MNLLEYKKLKKLISNFKNLKNYLQRIENENLEDCFVSHPQKEKKKQECNGIST